MAAKLTVRPAEAPPFEVEVGNTATIGRSRDNSVSLHFSPQVSRQHAIIRCHNAFQYQIMDLGSRNGTFVNGRRVITPTILTPGATIRISNNEIVFEQVEDPDSDSGYDVTVASGTDTADHIATVAVMVCDIRGFSTMSESLPEDILARTLGEWFRDAGDIIHATNGSVDKFIGDAVLAYWTQETDGPNETKAALESSRKLLEAASKRHWPSAVGALPFNIAVALHHGVVTCGNIGLVAQRDATIIGDTVNTVFRIEGVMKGLGQKVAVSDDFLTRLGSKDDFHDLGEHQLKGKNQQVRLFGCTPLPA